MGLATNRTWVTDNGEKKEETEFHRIVAWNKLAELCSQLLFKGRRVYVEGRLQTRQWTGQDGAQRQATEIVIEDMLVLDSKRQGEEAIEPVEANPVVEEPIVVEETPTAAPVAETKPGRPAGGSKSKTKVKKEEEPDKAQEVAEDIPF
jgi:single-strand DNA-binding protein